MKADEKRARDLVRQRSGGWCEVNTDDCQGAAVDWQHRRNRSQGGPWRPSNGLHVCRSCHHWIHANPVAAWRKGWTVRSWQRWGPTPVALGYRDHPAVLSDDGGLRDATDDELIACLALGFGVDLKET